MSLSRNNNPIKAGRTPLIIHRKNVPDRTLISFTPYGAHKNKAISLFINSPSADGNGKKD